MGTYLKSIAVKNFRGIGNEYQEATEFGMFNIFCGPNNSGKSTFLDLITRYLPINQRNYGSKLDVGMIGELDVHGIIGNPISVAVGIREEDAYDAVISKLSGDFHREFSDYLRTIIRKISINSIFWIENEAPYRTPPQIRDYKLEHLAEQVSSRMWQIVWLRLTNMLHGDLRAHWIPETIKKIITSQDLTMPSVHTIPAMRQIGPKGQTFEFYNGIGLIDKLAELQNPSALKQEEKKTFEKINTLLQAVTKNPQARIEIPHNREYILVHMNDRTLPLSSLGTGIEQIIMIASFCTVTNGKIICLEEPELHLHPILQRRLLEYLKHNTNNQYFISTHSASIIDFPCASVYRVRQEDGKTKISKAISNRDRFQICADLGHRASDIVQSNSIIWVEGPSDRIYVNHWLNASAPDLKESIHYSIMFYGGRLLSHLSAADDEVSDFISLRKLNRNIAIIIDSDRAYASQKINETKFRIRNEIEKEGGFVWITRGREIENYINPEIVQNSIIETHPAYHSSLSSGQFDHLLHFYRKSKNGKAGELEKNADKVKIARKICESPANLDIYDLRSQLSKLVTMIRTANGMD